MIVFKEINTIVDTYNWLIESGSLPEQSLEMELRFPAIYNEHPNNKALCKVGGIECPVSETYTHITYYFKQPIDPTITYRATSPTAAVLETKTLIGTYYERDSTTKIAPSIETDRVRHEIVYPFAIYSKSAITKIIINREPRIEIVFRGSMAHPSVEIEFPPKTKDKALQIYHNIQAIPQWPPLISMRPKQVAISEIARKLSSGRFHISAKADGIHVLIYSDLSVYSSFVIITDEGKILDYDQTIIPNEYDCVAFILNADHNNTLLVVEAEYCGPELIYGFDVLRCDIPMILKPNQPYSSRIHTLKYLSTFLKPLLYKPSYFINNNKALEALDISALEANIPNDGYIITHETTGKERFKLKTTNTVDVKLVNNMLVLGNGDIVVDNATPIFDKSYYTPLIQNNKKYTHRPTKSWIPAMRSVSYSYESIPMPFCNNNNNNNLLNVRRKRRFTSPSLPLRIIEPNSTTAKNQIPKSMLMTSEDKLWLHAQEQHESLNRKPKEKFQK